MWPYPSFLSAVLPLDFDLDALFLYTAGQAVPAQLLAKGGPGRRLRQVPAGEKEEILLLGDALVTESVQLLQVGFHPLKGSEAVVLRLGRLGLSRGFFQCGLLLLGGSRFFQLGFLRRRTQVLDFEKPFSL